MIGHFYIKNENKRSKWNVKYAVKSLQKDTHFWTVLHFQNLTCFGYEIKQFVKQDHWACPVIRIIKKKYCWKSIDHILPKIIHWKLKLNTSFSPVNNKCGMVACNWKSGVTLTGVLKHLLSFGLLSLMTHVGCGSTLFWGNQLLFLLLFSLIYDNSISCLAFKCEDTLTGRNSLPHPKIINK